MADLELELSLSAKKALQQADAFAEKVQKKFKAKPFEMEMKFKDADDKKIGDRILRNRIKLLADMQREQDRALHEQEKAEERSQKKIQANWERVQKNRIRLIAQYQKQQSLEREEAERKSIETQREINKRFAISTGQFRIAELKKMLRQADAEEERFIGRQIARQKRAARQSAQAAKENIAQRLVQSGRAAFAGDINFGPAGSRGISRGGRGGRGGGPPPLAMGAAPGQFGISSKAVMASFQVQQAIEDFSYAGFRGASNNIALLSYMLGGPTGLAVMGGLAAVSIASMIMPLVNMGSASKKAAEELAKLMKVWMDVFRERNRIKHEISQGFFDLSNEPQLMFGPEHRRQSRKRREAIGNLFDQGRIAPIQKDLEKAFGGGFGINNGQFDFKGIRSLKPALEGTPSGSGLLTEASKLEELFKERRANRQKTDELLKRIGVTRQQVESIDLGNGPISGRARFVATARMGGFVRDKNQAEILNDTIAKLDILEKRMKEIGIEADSSNEKVQVYLKEIGKNASGAAKNLAHIASQDEKVFESVKRFLSPASLKLIEAQVAINKQIEESQTGQQIARELAGEADNKAVRILQVQIDRKTKQYEIDRKRVHTLQELADLEAKLRGEISPLVGQITYIHDFEAMIKEQKQKQLDLIRDQISAQKKIISEKDREIRKNEELIKHTKKLSERYQDSFTKGKFGVEETQANSFAKLQNIRQKIAFRQSLPPELAFLGPNQSVLRSVLSQGDRAINLRSMIQGELIRRHFVEKRGGLLSSRAAAAGQAGDKERQAEILKELESAQLQEAKKAAQQGFMGRSQAALGAASATEAKIQAILKGQISHAQTAIQAAQMQKAAAQHQLTAAQTRLKSLQHMNTATARFMSATAQFAAAVARFAGGIGGPVLPGGPLAPGGLIPHAGKPPGLAGQGGILQPLGLGGPLGGMLGMPGVENPLRGVMGLPLFDPRGNQPMAPQAGVQAIEQGANGVWGSVLGGLASSVVNNNQQFVFNGAGGAPPNLMDAFLAQQRMSFLRMGIPG